MTSSEKTSQSVKLVQDVLLQAMVATVRKHNVLTETLGRFDPEKYGGEIFSEHLVGAEKF